jgi:hypothetical protein
MQLTMVQFVQFKLAMKSCRSVQEAISFTHKGQNIMTRPRKIVVQRFLLSPLLIFVLSQYSLPAKQSSTSLYGVIVCDTLSQDIKAITAFDKKDRDNSVKNIGNHWSERSYSHP